METAIIGLGRMGKNIALHLIEQGVQVVVYNRSRDDIDEMVTQGAVGAYSLSEISQKMEEKPIVAILYVPAGAPTDEVINSLSNLLPAGSILIDGGNSFYQDSKRRYELLRKKGIHFLDMGTSGGTDGARQGACLMVGGDREVYEKVRLLLDKMATPGGLGYFGPPGSGHFVKMIHNAVEYGMMGAIAEGFNLVHSSQFIVHSNNSTQPPISQRGGEEGFKIDLTQLAKVWASGSIVSGLLMNKAVSAFTKDPKLESIAGEVPRGETEAEMEWIDTLPVPHPVIKAAREERVETRKNPSFIGKVIAALRREFGGHAVKTSV